MVRDSFNVQGGSRSLKLKHLKRSEERIRNKMPELEHKIEYYISYPELPVVLPVSQLCFLFPLPLPDPSPIFGFLSS